MSFPEFDTWVFVFGECCGSADIPDELGPLYSGLFLIHVLVLTAGYLSTLSVIHGATSLVMEETQVNQQNVIVFI